MRILNKLVRPSGFEPPTSSTTEDLTVTVTEKVDDSGGPATEKVEEDDSPGFGIITAIAAIGAVLLIRRRL